MTMQMKMEVQLLLVLLTSAGVTAQANDNNWPAKCAQPIEIGRCRAFKPRWALDTSNKICVQFSYGGCDGNENNFETLEDCLQKCLVCPVFGCPECANGNTRDYRGCKTCTCRDDCALPSDSGPCKADITRYYHNEASRQCESFQYGGCLGNSNNFVTRDACFNACEPCPIPGCLPGPPCTLGFKKTTQGCQTCECLEAEDICSMPPDIGQCEKYVTRYYYNPASERCEPFVYGGCAGNENNFDNEFQCYTLCAKCPPVLCELFCEFGFDVNEDGCEICKCKESPCEFGKPLADPSSGQRLYCGLGSGGNVCPSESFCMTHPLDKYAVCCPELPKCGCPKP